MLRVKSAFTLAEVLITLGIIGVVSAMTLPIIISNTQGKENQALLKKAYSTLSQALLAMENDTGTKVLPQDYDWNKPFLKNFRKYFRLYATCNSTQCIREDQGQYEDGSDYFRRYSNYQTYDKKNVIDMVSYFDDGNALTADNMLLLAESHQNRLYLTVDVNGFYKKPNAWGHDLFTFQITRDGRFLPMGADGTDYTDLAAYCSKDGGARYNGIACTQLALTDPNYFKNLPR